MQREKKDSTRAICNVVNAKSRSPCPNVQCWRVCGTGGFAEFALFAYPRDLCRSTLSTLSVRGRGGDGIGIVTCHFA